MMGGGAWWVFWLVVPLLIIAVVVVLVVALTRRGPSGGDNSVPLRPSARAILDERYARGEIDHEEYVRRCDELGRSSS
ncbi:SHOCT domain-containing protein [Leifsonia sp. TF02-11]|nr:SHOCT domain-containing protein [Leifsonia sp. TF02-11]